MILSPPPECDHPYPGPLTEWIMPAPKVDVLCRLAGGNARDQYQGCMFKIGEHCYIIVAGHVERLVRHHETAHCNCGEWHP